MDAERDTPADDRPEALLKGLASRGDRRAMASLLGRYRGWVRRVAFRFTSDPARAEAAARAALLGVARSLRNAPIDGSLARELYASVRMELVGSAWASDGPGDPGVRAVIGALDPERREALMLRVGDGLTSDEAAAALGVSLEVFRERLREAIAALRADARVARYFEPAGGDGR